MNLWSTMTADQIDAVRRHLPPAEALAVHRAWLEARPGIWLGVLLPARYARPYSAAAPRTDALHALTTIPAAGPVRTAAYQVLIEQGRGLGKTETARGATLWRLLTGREAGVLVVSERADDAHAWNRWIMSALPRRGDKRALAAYLKTPLGQYYPTACWSGGVELLCLHRDPLPRAYVWCRGAGGKIRGLNEESVRPTMSIGDDIMTAATAWSDAETRSRRRLLDDEVVGCGTVEAPIVRVVLANAFRPGDLPDTLASEGWPTVRGSVWATATGRPCGPPATGAWLAAVARVAQAPEGPQRVSVAEQLLAASPDLPDGRVSACDQSPAGLLALQATIGTRAFARVYCCERVADGSALWPWSRVQRVAAPPSDVVAVGLWLDPRYSEDAVKNDYAAAAAVGLLRDGRRLVLAVEEARCGVEQARGLYWTAMDRARAIAPKAALIGGAEANGGVGPYLARDFATDADARWARGLPAPCPTLAPSTAAKYGEDRLDRLTGAIERGDLLLLDGALSPEAEQQCDRLGTGYHDDVPDAIERADALACPPADALTTWAAGITGR